MNTTLNKHCPNAIARRCAGATILAVALLAAGCAEDAPPATTAPSAGSPGIDAVLASFNGGQITMAETLREIAQQQARGRPLAECTGSQRDVDALVDCYRETASDIALGRVLAEDGTLDQAMAQDDGFARQRDMMLVARLTRTVSQEVAEGVTDEEVEARYRENEEQYVQPGSVVLWNIFRRFDDPENPQPTLELLQEARQRFYDGETFAALASEYSQSENRLRNGYVGPVQRGKMAPQLEEIAFALLPGEVSEPIEVTGGALLIHVSDVTSELKLDLKSAGPGIRRQLTAERTGERLSELADSITPPDDTLIIPLYALGERLKEADDQEVILQIGTASRTAGELLAAAGVADRSQLADEAVLDRLGQIYDSELRNVRLALFVNTDTEQAVATREAAREDLQYLAQNRAIDEWISSRMASRTEADDERIRAYFDDNRSTYQTPLRFRIQALEVALHAETPTDMRRLEVAAANPIDSESFSALAAAIDGTVVDHGWLTFGEFATHYPRKAQELIVQVEAGAAAPPFQQDEKLHLIWVMERDEPRPLSFDEAREDVLADYQRRFAKDLSRQIRAARLAEASFEFDEDAARQQLAPPAPVTS